LLIGEYTYRREGLSVLDLCCGKGGDIAQKWKKARIGHYVGSDLSKTAVAEAKERHKQALKNDRGRYAADFPAIFIVADASDHENSIDHILKTDASLKGIREHITFDIVSTQFAIHYMF